VPGRAGFSRGSAPNIRFFKVGMAIYPCGMATGLIVTALGVAGLLLAR